MNTTSFIGRLTKDPEVRTSAAGPVADQRVVGVQGPYRRPRPVVRDVVLRIPDCHVLAAPPLS